VSGMQRIQMTPDNTDFALRTACEVLSRGGLVLYPTETMYGAGVDGTLSNAVTKLLKFKNRPAGKPVSLLVEGTDAADKVVMANDTAKNIYETFLPGPVTVISQSRGMVDNRLESEFGTLGIRISSHVVAAGLAKAYGKPITATSANASGKARPYSVDIALGGLSDTQAQLIDLILDYGDLPRREPSTVIDTTRDVVVRAGEGMSGLIPTYTSQSSEETRAIARTLMESMVHAVPEKAIVFALEGEMGAGKTQFAKGIAEAIGVHDVITSPTYTLMKEYGGNVNGKAVDFIHMDCWRMPETVASDLGIDEYIRPHAVIVIEWANQLIPYLHDKADKIVGFRLLLEPESETVRRIHLQPL
jgi:L-threonylcarbamoyladenylate synthase